MVRNKVIQDLYKFCIISPIFCCGLIFLDYIFKMGEIIDLFQIRGIRNKDSLIEFRSKSFDWAGFISSSVRHNLGFCRKSNKCMQLVIYFRAHLFLFKQKKEHVVYCSLMRKHLVWHQRKVYS